MSKKSKSEAVVLLIDIGATVNQQDNDGQSFLSKSKQCASRIIQRKIFSNAKDQFCIILMGSKKMKNELDYPHIYMAHNWLSVPNWDTLKDIENLSATDVDSADWLDGLIVAINLLKNESEAKRFSDLKIVMMSNFATPLRSKDQVDDTIDALNDLKINLVVIGPQMDEEENDESENSSIKSNTQRKGEAIIGRIAEEADGIICGFYEAMSQLDHFQKVVARAQPWNCHLEIGQNIFIPISGFKKFSPKCLLKWKKKGINNNGLNRENVFFKGDEEVEKSDVINGYLFGKTVIPMSDDDKTAMALSTEKSFKLLGFTKKENVPRHISIGDSSHYIVPQSDVRASKVAVTSLVKALLELGMVGIVRKVYCKNTCPRVGALIPTCEQGCYFFYYVQLPFAEDERMTKLPKLQRVQPSQAQLDAADKLIDDFDLSKLEEDEDLHSKLVNPSVEHMNNLIVYKALNPNSKFPAEPSDSVKNLIQPNLKILENACSALENIKELFHLEEVEQKNYRKGAAEVFERNTTTSNMEVEDVKPQNLADSMASFIESKVTEIGTVDPVGNFHKLLELGQPLPKICKQMQDAIKKLLLTSNSLTGIQKPTAALSLLREHCVKQEPSLYNSFISSLKDDMVQRGHMEFWDVIVQDKLGLITLEENMESSISVEDADIFYQMKKTEQNDDVSYEMEAEDMLDMI